MSNINSVVTNVLNMLDGGNRADFTIRDVINTTLGTAGFNINDYWKPNVNICENNEEYRIYVDVPGVNKDTINVDFYNNKMTINGNRADLVNINSIRNEIIYGKFERAIILPISVTKKNSVSINLDNGVLLIKINKKQEEQNQFSVSINE
jgi:HSP20 family protein